MPADFQPHTQTPVQAAGTLRTDLRKGLSRARAKSRLRKYGQNVIRTEWTLTFADAIKNQCKGLTNLFLFFTSLILYLFDPQTPYLVTLFAVPLIAVCGAFVETYSASRLERVKRKSPGSVTVLRDGIELRVDARTLVPGDLIWLEKGALVPADARICEDDGELTVLETPVSGVKTAVGKSAVAFVKEDEPVHANMLYAGTILTGGSCIALVCFTGRDTLIRQSHSQTEEAKTVRLPLAIRRQREFSRYFSVAALIGAVLLIFTGALPRSDLNTSFLLAAAFSAASLCDAILPLAFLTFSEGAYHMAEDKFLLRNPDKLTRIAELDTVMSAKDLVLPRQSLELCSYRTDRKVRDCTDPPAEDGTDLLLLSLVCSDYPAVSDLSEFDRAVLDYFSAFRVPTEDVTGKWFRIDTARSENGDVSGVLSLHNDKNTAVLKGKPEDLLPHCVGFAQNGKEYKLDETTKRKLLSDAEHLAYGNAYVIAIASGTTSANSLQNPDAEKRLIWRGLLAFRATVESDTAGAVYRCVQAGIRPLLATGDPYYTAANLGKSTGILKDEGQIISSREIRAMDYGMFVLNAERYRVFLEPTDEQWHTVLNVEKELGHIVAVTAERQEELPLVKDADVSIVPTSSCDALRESADVLLQSGGLSTLVSGVTHAKAVCLRLAKMRTFTLRGFFTLFLLLFVTSLLGTPAMRVQEILLGAIFPCFAIALVFAAVPLDRRQVLESALPRRDGLPDKAELIDAAVSAGCAAIALLAAFFFGADTTAVMLGYTLSQFLFACVGCRDAGIFRTGKFGQKRLWLLLPALAAAFAFFLLIPPLRNGMSLVLPNGKSLLLSLGAVLGAHLLWQIRLFFLKK